ncbi:hypothetical protein FA95DRAFT_1614432 [Auriscalpium vulgare]|uniref:Uncharacterized protein n=1 Tax=Auriscalpium vulgare TaxID=40419 RepID=A0ACB8R153_9AGAM|nr:hypothetical protein FA95DRAFT_1614432 [Auriscalpium vulgare]
MLAKILPVYLNVFLGTDADVTGKELPRRHATSDFPTVRTRYWLNGNAGMTLRIGDGGRAENDNVVLVHGLWKDRRGYPRRVWSQKTNRTRMLDFQPSRHRA